MRLVIICLLALAGCVTSRPDAQPQNIIGIACAPGSEYLIERCAEAVGDVYGVFHQRALELMTDPATPTAVKDQIKQLDEDLTPVVRQLVQTANTYIMLREEQAPEADAKRAELAAQLSSVQPRVEALPPL